MDIKHIITPLCLPPFEPRLRAIEGSDAVQIFDAVRGKHVALTPEEWVRQCFVSFLIKDRNVPAARIANEVGIQQNGCRRRCDSVIYDGAACPLAICEYKAPSVHISEKVFDQIVRYNMELGVSLLIVSNGLKHYCCRVSAATSQYFFLSDIPSYPQMLHYHA